VKYLRTASERVREVDMEMIYLFKECFQIYWTSPASRGLKDHSSGKEFLLHPLLEWIHPNCEVEQRWADSL
jgi:hypothetical protein